MEMPISQNECAAQKLRHPSITQTEYLEYLTQHSQRSSRSHVERQNKTKTRIRVDLIIKNQKIERQHQSIPPLSIRSSYPYTSLFGQCRHTLPAPIMNSQFQNPLLALL